MGNPSTLPEKHQDGPNSSLTVIMISRHHAIITCWVSHLCFILAYGGQCGLCALDIGVSLVDFVTSCSWKAGY